MVYKLDGVSDIKLTGWLPIVPFIEANPPPCVNWIRIYAVAFGGPVMVPVLAPQVSGLPPVITVNVPVATP